MKYLLDTHTILWSLGDNENLSERYVNAYSSRFCFLGLCNSRVTGACAVLCFVVHYHYRFPCRFPIVNGLLSRN
jgi:hypothetical protein